jgi:E3 ubiquitin-protein ligase FANCL
MVLPATLSRDAGTHPDPPQDGQEEAGTARPRRPPAFYSSVFAQVRPARSTKCRAECGRSFPCFAVIDDTRVIVLSSQIEEVGWGQLASATGDDGVSCLAFRVV